MYKGPLQKLEIPFFSFFTLTTGQKDVEEQTHDLEEGIRRRANIFGTKTWTCHPGITHAQKEQ